MEVGRPCFLLVTGGSLADAQAALSTFFSEVEGKLGQLFLH